MFLDHQTSAHQREALTALKYTFLNIYIFAKEWQLNNQDFTTVQCDSKYVYPLFPLHPGKYFETRKLRISRENAKRRVLRTSAGQTCKCKGKNPNKQTKPSSLKFGYVLFCQWIFYVYLIAHFCLQLYTEKYCVYIIFIILKHLYFVNYYIKHKKRGRERKWCVAKYGDPYSEFVLCI